MASRTRPRVALLFLILAGAFLIVPFVPQAHASSNLNKVAVDPNAVGDLTKTSGTQSFTINVTDAPPINLFEVSLSYNQAVLQAPHVSSTIDYSSNVLVGTVAVLTECIDGLQLQGQCIPGIDQPGVISLAIASLGTLTANHTSGVLFTTNFNIIGLGLSQIHLISVTLVTVNPATGIASQVPTDNRDGYFSNVACPNNSSNPCKPPIPKFTYPPLVVQDRLAVFNASASRSQNPDPNNPLTRNATITSYVWDWGDGGGSPPLVAPLTNHTFRFSGAQCCTITLTVVDSYGIAASKSVFVRVARVWIDLLVVRPGADQSGVVPGAVIHITVSVGNNGTRRENATVEVHLENLKLLGTQTFQNMTASGRAQFTVQWDTTGYAARAYRIDATVDPVTDSKGGVIENSTDLRNNKATAYVLLVVPQPGSYGLFLGLGLFQSFSLGVVLLVVLAATIGTLLRRRPKPEGL